jgi:hypothetical protein
LDKVHLKTFTGCPDRQPNGSGRFSDTLSEIQMEKAETFILNKPVSFLRIVDDASPSLRIEKAVHMQIGHCQHPIAPTQQHPRSATQKGSR